MRSFMSDASLSEVLSGPIVSVVVAGTMLLACTGDQGGPARVGNAGRVSSGDAGNHVSSGDAGHVSSGDAGDDVSFVTDAIVIPDVSDAGPVADPWAMERDCITPAIEWYPRSWSFQKPNKPPIYGDTITKSQFAGFLNDAPNSDRAVIAGYAPHHQSGRSLTPIWGEPGEPFRVSLLMLNELESLKDHRAYLTVLVNYRPVEAHWVRWLEDRGGPTEEWTASGIAFDIEDPAELVDLEVPASAFPSPGVYEIAFLVNMGRLGYRHFDVSQRVHLFYGGFDWPTIGCFEEPMIESPNEWEADTALHIRVGGLRDGLVRVQGDTSVSDVTAPVTVAAGEVVDVEVSMFNNFDSLAPVAAFPTLEGAPITEEPWLYHASDTEPRPSTIAARRRFSVTMPDEPGSYDFYVVAWYFAMMPAVTPSGYEYPGVRTRREAISNTIRFIVEG